MLQCVRMIAGLPSDVLTLVVLCVRASAAIRAENLVPCSGAGGSVVVVAGTAESCETGVTTDYIICLSVCLES
jgi:hypothetical protein